MPRRRSGSLLPLELDILEAGLTLHASVGSFYGYSLAKAIAEKHGGGLTSHGTLYKALGRMVDGGLLEANWEPAETAEAEGRPRRKLYTVTGEGERTHAGARSARIATTRPAQGMA